MSFPLPRHLRLARLGLLLGCTALSACCPLAFNCGAPLSARGAEPVSAPAPAAARPTPAAAPAAPAVSGVAEPRPTQGGPWSWELHPLHGFGWFSPIEGWAKGWKR